MTGEADGRLTVSVVICAYTLDRWDVLQRAIKSVLNQDFRPDQVILVIDHNAELLALARNSFPKEVLVLENDEQQGNAGARNVGLRLCDNDVVAFLDDDAVAHPDWLARLIAGYKDDSVVGVGGLLVPSWVQARPRWFPDEFLWVVGCSYTGLPTNTERVRNLIGANMSLRRRVLQSVGGFRPGLERIGKRPFGVEETELCIRAARAVPSGELLHEPSAIAEHLVSAGRERPSYFVRMCFNEGRGKALMQSVVGRQDGLSSERAYARRVLPAAVGRGIADAVRKRDLSGLGRSLAVIVGVWAAASGYAFGRMSGHETVYAPPKLWAVPPEPNDQSAAL